MNMKTTCGGCPKWTMRAFEYPSATWMRRGTFNLTKDLTTFIKIKCQHILTQLSMISAAISNI